MNSLEFCHMGELSLLARYPFHRLSVSVWITAKLSYAATLCYNTTLLYSTVRALAVPALAMGALSKLPPLSCSHTLFFSLLFFLVFLHMGSWFQGSNLCPPYWKHGVLTIGPPGKSLWVFLVEHVLSLYTTRCSTLIARMSYPSGRTSHSSRALIPLLEGGVRNQDLGTRCPCFWWYVMASVPQKAIVAWV